MKILIDRVYFHDNATVGFLKLLFSGQYESDYLPSGECVPGKALYLCDTLEPRAIAWQDDSSIGQLAEARIPGLTAIPEGEYAIRPAQSKTHRRKMPFLEQVPEFKKVCLRTGKTADQSRGDILVGRLVPPKGEHCADHPEFTDSRRLFGLLYATISEAIEYGEPVSLQIASSRDWTYPSQSNSTDEEEPP